MLIVGHESGDPQILKNIKEGSVERFYDEYYFRPSVVWCVARKAVLNSHERHRLAKEARDYLSLRSNRKRFVVDQRKVAAARAAAG